MLLKSCARCGALIPYGRSHCELCAPIAEQAREEAKKRAARKYNRKYNAERAAKYTGFYKSRDWVRLARWYMVQREYRCEDCGRVATEVHHVQPIQTEAGWERRLDAENLAALCTKCHNKRHDRFRQKKVNKRV